MNVSHFFIDRPSSPPCGVVSWSRAPRYSLPVPYQSGAADVVVTPHIGATRRHRDTVPRRSNRKATGIETSHMFVAIHQ